MKTRLAFVVFVALSFVPPAVTSRAHGATIDDVLKRLAALERENATLRGRVKRLEGSQAAAVAPARDQVPAAAPVIAKAAPAPAQPASEWSFDARALYWQSASDFAYAFVASGTSAQYQFVDSSSHLGLAAAARRTRDDGRFFDLAGYYWSGESSSSLFSGVDNEGRVSQKVGNVVASVGSTLALTPSWNVETSVGASYTKIEDRRARTRAAGTSAASNAIDLDAIGARFGLRNLYELWPNLQLTADLGATLAYARAEEVSSTTLLGSTGINSAARSGPLVGFDGRVALVASFPMRTAQVQAHIGYDFVYCNLTNVSAFAPGVDGNEIDDIWLHGPSAGVTVRY
jgi:hypothetical protein